MCLFTNNCTPPLQLFALSPPSRLPPTPPHIPIPSPMTPTKIAPAGNMPESAGNMLESAGNMLEPAAAMLIPAVVIPEATAISSATIPIPPEPTVKLGSWHEIVIAKPAIMTANPAITIFHPAIRINTISTHAARVSAFAAWLEMVMTVMAVAPLTAYVYPLS